MNKIDIITLIIMVILISVLFVINYDSPEINEHYTASDPDAKFNNDKTNEEEEEQKIEKKCTNPTLIANKKETLLDMKENDENPNRNKCLNVKEAKLNDDDWDPNVYYKK